MNMVVDLYHWLLCPKTGQGEGSSVGGSMRMQPKERKLDLRYIRSMFEDAPTDALIATNGIIDEILRSRKGA